MRMAILVLALAVVSGGAFVCYLFLGRPPEAKEIKWGINFSQKQAQNLELDWKETYLALLDDLKIKNIKLLTHWDLIELEPGKYNFEDLDWQLAQAQKRNVKILLVVGLKTGRWPECHAPDWVKNQKSEVRNSYLLKYLEEIVKRYRERVSVYSWQVENEPFFPFGECPGTDNDFLKKEIALVKSLDFQKRPVVISDSGEFSFWLAAASLGDRVGTTLHRKVWFKELGAYFQYPLNPTFYWRRAQLIEKLFAKEVFVAELQAEPWCPVFLSECELKEQSKTMNLERFKENSEFAKKTGLSEIYLWGSEWWYWLKTKQVQPAIWDEAKKLF